MKPSCYAVLSLAESSLAVLLFLCILADEDDLQIVLDELDAIVDVRGLGLYLGLRMSTLQKIREDERTLEKEKVKIIQYWLRRKDIIRDKEREMPTWSHLADAVARENRVLSMRIRDKHCSGSVGQKY